MKEPKFLIFAVILLLFQLVICGCATVIPQVVEHALIESESRSKITVYYPVPDSFILKVHGASIYIDDEPYFFLRSGEHIEFYLEPGPHKIEITPISPSFDYRSNMDLITVSGESYFLKTHPRFEGYTFIPYYFIPVPAADIRFQLIVFNEDQALKEIKGDPVDPRKRILRRW